MTSDFLHNKTRNAKAVAGVDADKPTRFLNRELSWLAFNSRVLELAQDETWPLLERVRMLSISNSNLDEFLTVRVAGLRELIRDGVSSLSKDGLSPTAQMQLIDQNICELMQAQQNVWADLKAKLLGAQIKIVEQSDLVKADRDKLQQVFFEQVFPIITPIAVDPAHPFPFIPSGGLTLALHLKLADKSEPLNVLLPLPSTIERFVKLDSPDNMLRLAPLEVLLLNAVNHVFPKAKLIGHALFSVLRDSDLEIVDEADDLVHEFESALKRRVRGDAVRLKMSTNAPKNLRKIIIDALGVNNNEVFEIDGLLDLQSLTQICAMGSKKLLWQRYHPRTPERVTDFNGDIFAAIKAKDMLLHHPYESFDIVVNFLRQASRDQRVVAIKQTLYRTSHDSPIVAALCAAAESGKSVTAVVELKARFDEAANIRLARQLERAGVYVVYGAIDLKTHAKVSIVVRKEGGKFATYTHFGTGNYHPITANVYTDLSYFSCSKTLGQDAAKIFNLLSGYAQAQALKNVSIAPDSLLSDLLRYIDSEIEHAKAGRPAQIWAKLNSLTSPAMVDALYRASQAGVKIDLVVRGICRLRPGIIGLSDNIRVKSIVGRFLEHSRIICFGNGRELPNKSAFVFMSSADWMGRNLHGRVETMVKIENRTVHAQILSQIMAANLADTKNSWVLQPDGSYQRDMVDQPFDCHRFFMQHPSLSGRGSAGAKDVPKLVHLDE